MKGNTYRWGGLLLSFYLCMTWALPKYAFVLFHNKNPPGKRFIPDTEQAFALHQTSDGYIGWKPTDKLNISNRAGSEFIFYDDNRIGTKDGYLCAQEDAGHLLMNCESRNSMNTLFQMLFTGNNSVIVNQGDEYISKGMFNPALELYSATMDRHPEGSVNYRIYIYKYENGKFYKPHVRVEELARVRVRSRI